MSRTIPLDHEFDKHLFATLLKKAQGNRMQKHFAEDMGMSKSYLSSYIREKHDHPFTPYTLRRIYEVAHNNVSFEELLEASGYDSSKWLNRMKYKKKLKYPINTYNPSTVANRDMIEKQIADFSNDISSDIKTGLELSANLNPELTLNICVTALKDLYKVHYANFTDKKRFAQLIADKIDSDEE